MLYFLLIFKNSEVSKKYKSNGLMVVEKKIVFFRIYLGEISG